MTAVDDAARAVTEARSRVIVYLTSAGLSTPRATANADHLIAAVRAHDAEVVRALPYEPGADTIKDAWKDGQESAVIAIADQIQPNRARMNP